MKEKDRREGIPAEGHRPGKGRAGTAEQGTDMLARTCLERRKGWGTEKKVSGFRC